MIQIVKELNILPHIKVTVLVDNLTGSGLVLGEWGAAFLLQTEEHQILFDTGGGGVLLGNAAALDVNWAKTDAIVISHGHGDHTRGLAKALEACGPVDVYVHPEVFTGRFARNPAGMALLNFPLTREQMTQRSRKIIETVQPTVIVPGLMATGPIPRQTEFEDTGLVGTSFLDDKLTLPDPILDDQALFFRVPEGMVIVCGCAHSGVVNTMEYVCRLSGESRIHAIIGGSHLISAAPERIQKTCEALKKYDVQKIMLSHCTGVKAFAALAGALPGRCSWPGSGTVIRFGAK